MYDYDKRGIVQGIRSLNYEAGKPGICQPQARNSGGI